MEEGKKSKQWRKENKLRKMSAFVEICELNDRDRMNASASGSIESPTSSSDSSTMEPVRKKLKLNDGTSHSDDIHQDETEAEESGRKKFTAEELRELRLLLKERANQLKKLPQLSLKEPGSEAKLDVSASDRVPIFLADIQSLILSSTLRNGSPVTPRWCQLEKSGQVQSVNILLIEGAGVSDYLLAKEKLPALADTSFPFQFEVIMPSAYCGDLLEEICAVPMTRKEYKRLVDAHGSLREALETPNTGVFKVLRAFFPIQQKSETSVESDSVKNEQAAASSTEGQKSEPLACEPPQSVGGAEDDAKSYLENTCDTPKPDKKEACLLNETEASEKIENSTEGGQSSSDKNLDNIEPISLPPSDKFPRTALLLSAPQMIEEGYPLLINDEMRHKYHGYVFSKPRYKEVSNFSPMYALDCEMCITCTRQSELTRIAIVNEKHETVLDTLVQPYNRITQYLTKYSGITAQMMRGVTTRLEDVQKFIQENLEPDAILVGQSLQMDLKACKLIHPYCIDTSVIFNITGDRYRKSKLSLLSDHFLNEPIQKSKDGHSPVEDSLASLKLVQLKLAESLEFGDEVLMNQEKQMDAMWVKPEWKPIYRKSPAKKPRVKQDISSYANSLFYLTTRAGKHATIVSTPALIEKYLDYLDAATTTCEEYSSAETESQEKNSTQVSKARGVSCVIADSNKSVIERAALNTHNSFLSVGHIQLSASESDSLAVREDKILKKINHYITRLQESASMNSLSIVVLCGREKSSNGVCFVNLRTRKVERKVIL